MRRHHGSEYEGRNAVRTPPRGDASTHRAARVRQKITGAARTAFLRDGFDATLDELVAISGVSRPTIYKYYGSKEALFVAVISKALEEVLAEVVSDIPQRLQESDDLRAALKSTARAWAHGMTRPDVLKLHQLVTREVHRFPALGAVWRENGPGRVRHALAVTFQRLATAERLEMPDDDTAITQLLSLTIYPHLLESAHGMKVEDFAVEQLIDSGVDMFLSFYKYRRPVTAT
uniref:TetR/AcrR family transcriptional regulator n=1 Tax=Actinomadura sp. CA-154981 TaxID=3240037 RepID=UPI003F4941B0